MQTLTEFQKAVGQSLEITQDETLPTFRKPKDKAIISGIIDVLVERSSFKRPILPPTQESYELLFSELKEACEASGISTTIYCNRSGFKIYDLEIHHVQHMLTHYRLIRDTKSGDEFLAKILDKISFANQNTALPFYVYSTGENLALLREHDTITYVIRALSDLFKREHHPNAENYAIQLHNARLSLERYEQPLIAYVAECLHLYHTNIRDMRELPANVNNPLLHYNVETAINSACSTQNNLAHLCRRIVQLIYNLIAHHRGATLSVNQLSTRDLLSLRIHYKGSEAYREQKAKLRAAKILENVGVKSWRKNATPEFTRLSSANINANDNLVFDMFDTASAFITTLGKQVELQPETKAQELIFHEVNETIEETTDLADLFHIDNLSSDDPYAGFTTDDDLESQGFSIADFEEPEDDYDELEEYNSIFDELDYVSETEPPLNVGKTKLALTINTPKPQAPPPTQPKKPQGLKISIKIK